VEIYPDGDLNKHVKKDTPLLKLDDRLAMQKLEQAKVAIPLAEANIAQAEANREAAEIAVKKFKELLKGSVGYQKDLDKAEVDLKAAQALLKAARVRKEEAETARNLAQLGVDLTILRSPIEGTIIDKKVVVGQTVSPLTSTPLFTIAGNLKRMEVLAQ